MSVDDAESLPAHIADSVSAMARVNSEHQQAASGLDRALSRLIVWLGHPKFTPVLTALILAWVTLNLCLKALGFAPLDPPPFPWLSGVVAVAALYMTGIILSTQRREDQLTTRREQLTLELAIVIEHKTSKLIELVEKLRRDHPDLVDHIDTEAKAMSSAADPQVILEAIKKSHDPAPS